MKKNLEKRANESKYLSVRPPPLSTYHPLADFYCSAHPLAPIAADVAPFSQLNLAYHNHLSVDSKTSSAESLFDFAVAYVNDCLMKPIAYITAVPLAKACIDSVAQFF
ncbi:MAG: hypothetical protein KKF46_00395 [Nanoarchaeota archaeon]|nr:hypothetical protein [Nanoarchaeota archaeon]MBU1320793.1 hypothetical protein [Nanoarchaeota archaeon]MBU1598298.1 hypothetical protein [Nanoarchaeota archaeon]MBU2442262.1 hypothetical protein [Nanoarchaeota archaeon]